MKFFKKKVIAIITLVVIIIGFVLGGEVSKKSEISEDNLQGLISQNYSIENLEIKNNSIEFIVRGNLQMNDIKDFSNELYKKSKNWEQNELKVFFVSKDANTKNLKEEFFVTGLTNKVIIDKKKDMIKIGTFVGVPSIEKSRELSKFKETNIKYKDNNVEINVSLPEINSLEQIVSQSKTFSIMFRDINKDKDIDNIQLNINTISNNYIFNTKNENVIEVIENIKQS
ncbi:MULTISPECIES: hypothetical protein [unclassified Clostridioides]|uniref:hypothetical protein n=1 Tax=unclassified Clostridioides TaxID=2635829 RepID=UPI001D1076ED|nr:hypothetical protein [Clostridioides sp. ES-S-0145-01]MCC0681947.1 hypothetical protein [Clostridioides sp. ES-S-0005-03]MCC0709296.1 hypothetical protein [Clostridioides sp. ES-S-0190-01]UDN64139.1 hypothetical protein IC758_19910 [Clostridioides sp. ES-W-0016-02]